MGQSSASRENVDINGFRTTAYGIINDELHYLLFTDSVMFVIVAVVVKSVS
jgi:hypothetical protein